MHFIMYALHVTLGGTPSATYLPTLPPLPPIHAKNAMHPLSTPQLLSVNINLH